MKPTPLAAWTLARAVAGHHLNGEANALPPPFREMARVLADAPDPVARAVLWDGMATALPDLVLALSAVDPDAPAPEAFGQASYATLADVARIVADQPWLWRGWLARGVLNVVASDPGIGKTRLGLDLARRLWHGLPWPDGQPNDLPPGTRTLWIQADQAFPEMLQAARDFRLPEEAVALGSSPDEPTGSLDLDDPEALQTLGERIQAAGPALVVIDTVGMTTARNLCRPEEARAFFAPVLELARSSRVAFLGLTHLSANKEALGRRIVEKARVVAKMTQPDPEGQPNRRRLWVDKTAVTKPPPLGITMGTSGNEYDDIPPTEPDATPHRSGRAPTKRDACKDWLAVRLATPRPVQDIRTDAKAKSYSADTLYSAKLALGVDEYTVNGRKWWKLPKGSCPEPTEAY